MRILVTGSREIKDTPETRMVIINSIATHVKPRQAAVVVHGDCPTGADNITRTVVEGLSQMSLWNQLTQEPHPADWDKYGRSAGPKRNQEMVDAGADQCIAFFKRGAGNRGTTNCANAALKAGIPVEEVWID